MIMISLRRELKVSPSVRFGCRGVSGGWVGLCAVECSGVRFCGKVSDPVGYVQCCKKSLRVKVSTLTLKMSTYLSL